MVVNEYSEEVSRSCCSNRDKFNTEDCTSRQSKRKKRSARAYAMDHLARREMSFHELVTRLVTAEYPEDEAYAVVEQLRLENLQNDQRFVEAYVLSKTRRGQGPRKIQYEIKAKKVKSSLVTAELVKYDGQWLSIALLALRKRYSQQDLLDLAKKQKAFQYLLRKGHETAMIYQALEAAKEAEIIE